VGIAVACGSVTAQDAGSLRITPTANALLTYVDSTLAPGAGEGRRSDLITQIRPGLQMSSRSGRFSGTLNYMLDASHHSNPGFGAADTLQHTLNAALNAELVDRWIFVDATANVSQQSISAFGQQSINGQQANNNRTEVSQLSVRPYARGRLSDVATYKLSVDAQAVHAKDSPTPDSRSANLSLSLDSANTLAFIGWSASASQQRSSFSGGQASDNGRVSVSLLIRPNSEWSGSLRGGQETTSIGGVYRRQYSNWGGDLRWTPSPRTTASVSGDERYFGRAYSLTLDHRFVNSSIRYSSIRDTSGTGNPTGVGQPVTLYQLFYQQFASVQPDPVLRDQLVRDFLRALGQDPNAVVAGGFVNGGVSLQKRDDLALSYAGRRFTLTLQAYSSDTRRLDTPATAAAVADTGPVRQYGVNTSASYRLTPSSSLTLSGSRQNTRGTELQAGNQLSSLGLSWSDQIGKHTTTALNARYSVFEGPANPNRETSLSATLSLQF
jgi:uncharacterized protein (PEP-CTERM system associated)